jgi:hypothetical protein
MGRMTVVLGDTLYLRCCDVGLVRTLRQLALMKGGALRKLVPQGAPDALIAPFDAFLRVFVVCVYLRLKTG